MYAAPKLTAHGDMRVATLGPTGSVTLESAKETILETSGNNTAASASPDNT